MEDLAKKAPSAVSEAAGLPEDAAGTGRTPDECAFPKGARKPETDPAGFGPTGRFYANPSVIGPADCGETGRPPDGVPACRHGPRSKKAALPAMAGAGDPGRAPGAFGGSGAAAFAIFKGDVAAAAAPRCGGGACANRMSPARAFAAGSRRGRLGRRSFHPAPTVRGD